MKTAQGTGKKGGVAAGVRTVFFYDTLMYLGLVSFLQLAKQSLSRTQTPTPFHSKTLSPSEALHRLLDLPFHQKQILGNYIRNRSPLSSRVPDVVSKVNEGRVRERGQERNSPTIRLLFSIIEVSLAHCVPFVNRANSHYNLMRSATNI